MILVDILPPLRVKVGDSGGGVTQDVDASLVIGLYPVVICIPDSLECILSKKKRIFLHFPDNLECILSKEKRIFLH